LPTVALHAIVTGTLTPRSPAQPSLFDGPGERAETLARVKREVNLRHGRFAVRSGATLPLASIYRDVANDFDVCDVRGKSCF
jgi:DNA polymerase V